MANHIINPFGEVVPVTSGRVSNDTRTYRAQTDFEVELLAEIEELKSEVERLQEECADRHDLLEEMGEIVDRWRT